MATDWKKIKEDLSSVFGVIYLRVDGYLVTAAIRRDGMRLVVIVYIDGKIDAKWYWVGKESRLNEMGEIARKFYCLKKIRQPKNQADFVKAMEKACGKRECKKRGYYDHHYMAIPEFSTPGAFVAHIKKHNESVEILDRETYDLELAIKDGNHAA